MNALLFGTGLAALAFFIHVVLWRVRVPRGEWRALVLVFTVIAVLAFSAVLISPRVARFGMSTPRLILAGLLFGGFGIVYLILFSALESDSPTLTMLQLVWQQRRSGITEGELADRSAERAYAQMRLQQMLRDGLAEQVGSRILATRRGRRVTLIVLAYCRILGVGPITRLPTGQR
jgi:hypothetical protein